MSAEDGSLFVSLSFVLARNCRVPDKVRRDGTNVRMETSECLDEPSFFVTPKAKADGKLSSNKIRRRIHNATLRCHQQCRDDNDEENDVIDKDRFGFGSPWM